MDVALVYVETPNAVPSDNGFFSVRAYARTEVRGSHGSFIPPLHLRLVGLGVSVPDEAVVAEARTRSAIQCADDVVFSVTVEIDNE